MREKEPSITKITVGDVTVEFAQGSNAFAKSQEDNDVEELQLEPVDEHFGVSAGINKYGKAWRVSEGHGQNADLRRAWEEQKAKQEEDAMPQEKSMDLYDWYRLDVPAETGT